VRIWVRISVMAGPYCKCRLLTLILVHYKSQKPSIITKWSIDTDTRSDGRMWSGEFEAQKSRYTSDSNAAWLQTGALLIALQIWQQNASGFRRYGNYPREVTAPAVIYWGTISHAGCAILILHILSRIIHPINIEHALPVRTFPGFPRYLCKGKAAGLDTCFSSLTA